MYGRTDGRTDVRTYGRTYGNSPLCPTGLRPFGAAAQKGRGEVRKNEWKEGQKGESKERTNERRHNAINGI